MGFKDKARKNGTCEVIAVINQKGGVGKSTTTVNLAACLGEQNRKVLIVDFDPQGNSTSGYGIDKNDLKGDVYDAILNDALVEDLIIESEAENVCVLPATIQLAGAEIELVSVMAREIRLKDALDPVKEYFDFIIIDCPPSLGLLTINALTASDSLLIPIQSEFYALEGVSKLLESMKMVKSRINKDLYIYGVLMTMFDSRTTLSKQVAAEVQTYFGDKVFETYIPRSIKLSEAPSYGQPINLYAPGSKGAVAYESLAKEVIARGN